MHYEQSTAQNWEPYWGFMKEAMIEVKMKIQFFDLPQRSSSISLTLSTNFPFVFLIATFSYAVVNIEIVK